MNRSNVFARKLQFLPVLLTLAAAVLACQFTGGSSKTPTSPASPAATAAAGGSGSQAAHPSEAGLAALTSYHQVFSTSMKGTYQGKPYESSSSVDRRVNGQDEISLVQATTHGQAPFYMQYIHLGGQVYVQQKAGQACRAQDQASHPEQDLDPALKLPPVFGAAKAGSDTVDGISSTHETFNADAVRNQAGKNGTAVGEMWLAQDGGAVLKYQLSIEIKDGDFIGTRTWTYVLSDVNKDVVVVLPDGCLPLLSELLELPGATNVVSIPGFMSYTANSNIDAAVKFFQQQLPVQKWYTLPGDQPQPASALLKFARAAADGSGQLLVIQLSQQDQNLLVVLQVVKTHQPLQPITTPAVGVTPGENGPTETPGGEAGPDLPTGLPVYPEAQVLLQNSKVWMALTNDALDKVAKYYQDQMTAAGWSLTDTTNAGGVTTQTWKKDDITVMVVLMPQKDQTQIVISPQQ